MSTNPKEFGNTYWHTLTYPVKPKGLWEKAYTQEIDEPFRAGEAVAIRLPFTCKAVVIGRWVGSHAESEALTYAIRGRYLGDDELDWDVLRYGTETGAKDDTTQKQ